LLYPPVCGFCGEINEDFLCKKCSLEYENLKISKIQEYNKKIYFFSEHFYLFEYKDIIRDLLIKYKFGDNSYLYKTISKILVEDKKFSEEFIKKYDYIVSVPIHSKRMHQRGYNQSKLIAKEIAKLTQKKYIDKVLIKIKNVEAQSSLNRISRIQNIKGVFELGKNSRILEGKNILIVDDIYTTGATVNECAKILRKAGVVNIGICTVAKD